MLSLPPLSLLVHDPLKGRPEDRADVPTDTLYNLEDIPAEEARSAPSAKLCSMVGHPVVSVAEKPVQEKQVSESWIVKACDRDVPLNLVDPFVLDLQQLGGLLANAPKSSHHEV